MRSIILSLSLLLLCSFASPQEVIKGTVKDETSKQPIVGASVYSNNKVVAVTNDKGEFNVSAPVKTITITAIGYQSETVDVKGSSVEVLLGRVDNDLNNIVISSTSAANKKLLYQPQSITRLTPKELTRGTGLFLDDAINTNVPGVSMNRRSVSGGQQFNIRGYGNGVRGTNGMSSNFDGQGYKVYLNGLAITDAEGINVMDDIDFGSIGNVEVLKGPSGSLYGLAIAGVVNLKTIQPVKGKTSVGQDIQFGSYGLQRYTTSFQSATETTSWLLNYGYQKSDGYMAHTASSKKFFNAVGDFKLNDKQSLSIYAAYTNSYDERGGELTITQYNNKDYSGNPEYIKRNAHSEVIGFKVGVGHTYRFNSMLSNTTSIFGSTFNNNASSAGGWTDKNPLNVGMRSTFDSKFTLSKNVILSGITGIEAQRTNNQTIGYFMKADPANPTGYFRIDTMRSNQFAVSSTASLFTQWTLTLPADLSITAGLGVSSMNITLNDRFIRPGILLPPLQYKRSYNGMVSPFLAINKVVSKEVSLYLSYSKGYKAPVSSYFFIPFTGQLNTNLESEVGNQFEIGSKGSLFRDKLTYQLALFNTVFSNKMYAQPVPLNATTTAYSYIANGGKQVNKGVEVLLKYVAFVSEKGFLQAVKPFVNFTYSDFKYKDFKFRKGNTNELQDYTGFAVGGVSKYVFNAGVDITAAHGIYATLYYSYKDKMPITADNMNMAPSFNLLNAKLGFRKSLSKHFDIDAFAGGTNLTGVQYYYMVFVNQLPDAYVPAPLNTNWFGGVNLRYNF